MNGRSPGYEGDPHCHRGSEMLASPVQDSPHPGPIGHPVLEAFFGLVLVSPIASFAIKCFGRALAQWEEDRFWTVSRRSPAQASAEASGQAELGSPCSHDPQPSTRGWA